VYFGLLTPLVFIFNGVLDLRTVPDEVNGLPLATFVYASFTEGSYPQILRARLVPPFATELLISQKTAPAFRKWMQR
jgi:hypothetical protein